MRSMRVRRLMLVLLGVPTALAVALPRPGDAAQRPPAPATARSVACLNLTVAPSELRPTSCWVTGPTSSVIAGTDPRDAASRAVYVVHDQEKRRWDVPGAGRLTIRSVSGDQVCLADSTGEAIALDSDTGALRPDCAAPSGASAQAGGVKAATTQPEQAGAASAPAPTTSLYVYGAYLAQCPSGATSGCPLYTYGTQDTTPGLVVLDFGAPCYNPNTLVYGTQLFNTYSCTPDAQLVPLAQAWIRGYQSANPASAPVTVLGLGTSNSLTGADPPGFALTSSQMYSSGFAWFGNVVQPVATGLSGSAAPITVWAASDIEQSSGGDWYDAATTRPWLDGYQAAAGTPVGSKCGATTPYQMVDYGDYVPSAPGWSAADVYFVSWGAPLACALPEIYYSGNENGWVQLSNQWAPSHGLPSIQFTGVMSEDGANGSLSAAQSWNTLASKVNQSPPYLTVITGGGGPATPFLAPTAVVAVPGATSATVSWKAPQLDGGRRITGYSITPYRGNLAQTPTVVSATPPPVTAVVNSLTNGTLYTFTVTASTSGGSSPESAHSNTVTPSDAFPYTAVSWQQYQLTGNDGVSWTDLDATNLSLSITPGSAATAILTANADLWTANAGINQDLGIFVSANGAGDTLVSWKESGGYGGTYSPNAAFLQTTMPMTAGTTYSVRLRWKANKPQGSAVIYAGAGNGRYSPTRLTVQLMPAAASQGVASDKQYAFPGVAGWTPIDPAALSFQYTASSTGTAVIAGNADLWTSRAGYNQDLGIFVDNTLVAWKESGGFAGTYSPNAAFVLAAVPMSPGAHAVTLAFKGNRATPTNTIFAGAGGGPSHSPTTLSLQFLPTTQVMDAASGSQYRLASSDGSSWTPIDGTTLTLHINRADNCLVTLTGNADLWTSAAGINQDIGISVIPSDAVTYPAAISGWKESGGFAGTFSPNAAAVQSVFAMVGGTSYTATLVWKTNTASAGAAHAGAGPGPYSPTRLTAVLVCQ